MGNSQYFPYIRRHVTKGILHFLGESPSALLAIVGEYWWIFFLLLLVLVGLFGVYRKLLSVFQIHKVSHVPWYTYPLFALCLLGMQLVALRGGIQGRVLNSSHAQVLGSYETAILILNAPFFFIRSYFTANLEEKKYFLNGKEELRKELTPPFCALPRTHIVKNTPPPRNVVIVILESFGSEFIGHVGNEKSYTPFFDSLKQKGAALYVNSYANAVRSIQALLPIFASLPNWMNEAIVKTRYINNRFPTLGNILKKRGYRTLFAHGADKGTMYFDTLAATLGLSEYYSYSDFPNHSKESDDGVWGVFDEPFFLYTLDVINRDTTRPFLATLFSLSSHHPFVIPERYANKFTKGKDKFHRSIAYTDYALGKFFEKAHRQVWAKDTLFVITADHPPISSSNRFLNRLTRKQVPILFYRPGYDLSYMPTQALAQQLDIFPTILDFLGITNPQPLLLGRSLFDNCSERYALLFDENLYWILTSQNELTYSSGEGYGEVYKYYNKELSPFSLSPQRLKYLLNKLRAYVQYYNNGLLYNDL